MALRLSSNGHFVHCPRSVTKPSPNLWFVLIRGRRDGHPELLMGNNGESLAFFASWDEADAAARGNAMARHFGFEVYKWEP